MPATPQQRAAFGQRLRSLLTQRGTTLQVMVDDLKPKDPKMSVARLSSWERGEYAPASTEHIDMLEAYFDVPGVLYRDLGTPPPQPSEIDELRQRVEAIEEHLGLGQAAKPGRHLRAASSPEAKDPGTRTRKGKPRPTGAPSEFE